jgi:hypothetical protein
MSKLIRLAAAVLCVGVRALGVVLFDPACPLTYPPRRDSGTRASMAEEVARNEELDQREDAIRRRRDAKAQLAAEVIARRRGLAEAIEQFRALDQEWPELRSALPTPEELGISADEWGGRDVLYFVQLVLSDRPDEAAAVAGRLEMELQELLTDRKKRPPAPAEPRTERSR